MAETFGNMLDDFRDNVRANREPLAAMLRKSPNLVYQKLNELAVFVGSRYGFDFQLHFPVAAKISDIDSYGTENVGIVVDKFRKNFPIPRDSVKSKALELLGPGVKPQDAYMYEGKEGVRIVMPEGRIEILPGSVHFWCKINESVRKYGDWMMDNLYSIAKKN
ncbi:MAG: hypothetical protein ACRD99_00735 [Nitrososphaera sp.]